MKLLICALTIGASVLNTGCSTKMGKVALVGLVTGAGGAGLGYEFVHHGRNKEYQIRNTIITSSLFAAAGAGLAYWYQSSLEEQRIELASKFSRGAFLENELRQVPMNSAPSGFTLSNHSVKLDDATRWVIPNFRKRELPSQRGEQELISSHFAWEIAQPGFFISRDNDPSFFKEEEKNEGH